MTTGMTKMSDDVVTTLRVRDIRIVLENGETLPVEAAEIRERRLSPSWGLTRVIPPATWRINLRRPDTGRGDEDDERQAKVDHRVGRAGG